MLSAIRRESQRFAAFEGCGHFAVNILADDQIALSQHFAKSGPDKFRDIAQLTGLGNAPLLHGAAATFECSRTQACDGEDYLILLGEVTRDDDIRSGAHCRR